MIDLSEYLENHKKEIVDAVESNNVVLTGLVNELSAKLSMGRNGPEPQQSWIDKAHVELAIAIFHSLWCGWLSQAKNNSGKYKPDDVDSFKQAISKAFEVGQKYAAERP